MKPTDEERRETAEKLRTMCMGGCRYAEQFYELLKEKVMNAWDFHEFEDVADRLADLIEPEQERTCRIVDVYIALPSTHLREVGRCDQCGESIETNHEYCFNCGARVAG